MKQHYFILVALFGISGCANRSQRRNNGTGSRQLRRALPMKGISQTNLDEAITCKNYYAQSGDLGLAAKYLQHALNLTKEHTARSELMLELADRYMELGQRGKAGQLYTQYKMLYPGSPAITYVLYREVLAHKGEALMSTKDQTKTIEALELGKSFIKEFPDEEHYTHEVKRIIRDCYLKLMRTEVAVAKFYLKKYRYEARKAVLNAAHKRVEFMLNEYVSKIDGAQELLGLSAQIDDSSPASYRDSLERVIEQLDAYVQEYAESEDTFITRLFETRRYGRYQQKTRL